MEHLLDIGEEVSLSSPLTTSEDAALAIQRSLAFWREPKELLLTLATCCVASLTQGWFNIYSADGIRANCRPGWDQVANGNLGKSLLAFNVGFFSALTLVGWPKEFGLTDVNNPNSSDGWKFAAIQAMPWFSAAFLGSYLSDPLSEYIGR